jgi:O-methyltransferase domain
MYQLIFGYMAVPAIGVAAKLRIPDLIAGSAMSAEELAGLTSADAPSLSRLLRFLSSLGIFIEDSAGRFRHTPLSESLRSDAPQSFSGRAIMVSSEYIWRPWGDLHHAVLTGKPGFDRVHGVSVLEYLAAHPDELAIRNAAMTSISSVELPQILAAYDFSQFKCIVDLGGGHGALLYGILSKHPKMRGILADLPHVVAGATLLRSKPMAERCEIIRCGSFPKSAIGRRWLPDEIHCSLLQRRRRTQDHRKLSSDDESQRKTTADRAGSESAERTRSGKVYGPADARRCARRSRADRSGLPNTPS